MVAETGHRLGGSAASFQVSSFDVGLTQNTSLTMARVRHDSVITSRR